MLNLTQYSKQFATNLCSVQVAVDAIRGTNALYTLAEYFKLNDS